MDSWSINIRCILDNIFEKTVKEIDQEHTSMITLYSTCQGII